MRILKFAKTDLLQIKRMIWALLFPVYALIILLTTDEGFTLPAFSYCLFAAIILCTVPLSGKSASETGFLDLLPGKKGEQTKGHFLFALLLLLLFGVLALAAIAIAHLIRPTIVFDSAALYLSLTGVALLFAAVEILILSLFHSDNTRAIAILRMAPAFLFWFGGMMLKDLIPDIVTRILSRDTLQIGLIIFGICLLLYALLAQLCSTLISRQDAI
jgi:hypothetical protein